MWMRKKRAGEATAERIDPVYGSDQPATDAAPAQQAPALIIPALEALCAGRYDTALQVPGVTGGAIAKLAVSLEGSATATLKRTVSISWEASETMISVASMARDIDGASANAETISSAAEELTAAIGGIADTGATAADEAARARQETETGIGEVDRAGAAMNTISTEVRDMTERLNVLQKAVEQIAEMTQTIEDISNQTNLLALNATIEAARAGEAGRGFAVVASEVKALSQQTARATEQIRERTNALTDEMLAMMKAMGANAASVTEASAIVSDVSQRFHGVGHQIAEVSGRISDMAHSLEQQKGATEEISRAINLIAEESSRNRTAATNIVKRISATGKLIGDQFAELDKLAIPNGTFERAKADHMVTKKRLAEAMAGFRRLSAQDLPRLDACSYTRACQEAIDPGLRQSAEYRAFADLHGRFHTTALKVMNLHTAGDTDGAKAAFETVGTLLDEFAAATDRLAAAQPK